MLDGNITYHELMDMHIKHLKELEKGSSDAYMRLQGMITHMYHDSKKNRDANLKGIMHQLVDDGRINMTHEQIDKK